MSHFSFIFYQEKSKKNLNTIASLEARKAFPFSAKQKRGIRSTSSIPLYSSFNMVSYFGDGITGVGVTNKVAIVVEP